MDITPEQCLEARAALPLYVGADLDPEEMETVGAHLARCAPCDGLHARALAARAVLLEGLSATGERPVPSIWEGIRGQLSSEVPAQPRRVDAPILRPQVARWGLRRTGIGAAAAAAAVVLCFGLAHLVRPELGDAPGSIRSSVVAPSLMTHVPGAAISGVAPARTADDTAASERGGLIPVGASGTPLFRDAVEVRVDQGTFPWRVVPSRPDEGHRLIGTTPQLMRDRR